MYVWNRMWKTNEKLKEENRMTKGNLERIGKKQDHDVSYKITGRAKNSLSGGRILFLKIWRRFFALADPEEPLKENPVDHEDLNRWEIGKEELYRCAMKSMPAEFPVHVKTAAGNRKRLDQEPVFIVSQLPGNLWRRRHIISWISAGVFRTVWMEPFPHAMEYS